MKGFYPVLIQFHQGKRAEFYGLLLYRKGDMEDSEYPPHDFISVRDCAKLSLSDVCFLSDETGTKKAKSLWNTILQDGKLTSEKILPYCYFYLKEMCSYQINIGYVPFLIFSSRPHIK